MPWAQQASTPPPVPPQLVAPTKPAKKSTSCGTGCLAVFIGLGVLGYITDYIGKNTAGTSSTSSSSSVKSASPQAKGKSTSDNSFQDGEVKTVTQKGKKMTVAYVDGKFYSIISVERQRTIEDQFTKTTADGRFWIIKLVIQNSSKEGGTVTTSLMKLIDGSNREFDTSSAGTTALVMSGDKSAELFMGEINPGITKAISLVFDVPEDENNFKLKIPPATFSLGKEALLPVPKPPFQMK